MKRGARILLLAVLVVVIAALAWEIFREREPEYQGKTLSEWLENYTFIRDTSETAEQIELRRTKSREADEAVRNIGTKALPFLGKMLTGKDSKFVTRLKELAEWQNIIHFRFADRLDRQLRALEGVRVLGKQAGPLIPMLGRALNEQDIGTFDISAEALVYIGPEAFDTLISALTNTDARLRCCVTSHLSEWKLADESREALDYGPLPFSKEEADSLSERALPVLLKLMQDPDYRVRGVAIRSLGHIHRQPDKVIPEILKALNDPREKTHQVALNTLCLYGEQAQAAVPAIIKALEDTDPNIRESATNALRQVDPKAAEKLGIK